MHIATNFGSITATAQVSNLSLELKRLIGSLYSVPVDLFASLTFDKLLGFSESQNN